MSKHPYRETVAQLDKHYSALLSQYGDTPEGVQWGDLPTQEKRLEILAAIGDLRTAKILDFGCGTGHLLSILKKQPGFQGEYTGYDISADMIAAAAQKFPAASFQQWDILQDGVPEDFDYVFISGTFNNLIADNWGFMTSILQTLFPHVRKGLAFNGISCYVDYQETDLYYMDPEAVFRFCKEHLSPAVTLRHDYYLKPGVLPYEFSIYAFQSDIAVRKKQMP